MIPFAGSGGFGQPFFLADSPKQARNFVSDRASPGASFSASRLIRLVPASMGLFRFLLEAYDNLALFTVLDPKEASLRLRFSPDQSEEVQRALQGISTLVDLEIRPWP